MSTQSRAVPHLVLGTLTALAVLAIVVSLLTAPANAEQQLRLAAKDTVAADDFVIGETFTVSQSSSTSGTSVQRQEARIVYRAPDRVEETINVNGSSVTVLAIGRARFERSGNRPWVALATRGAIPDGAEAAAEVLMPLETLSTATDVVPHGDERYSFVPGQRSELLYELLGSQGPSLEARNTTFEAAVSGEFLRLFRMTARVPGGRVDIRLVLGSFDHAPALEAPPASELAPGGPGR